jgi:hypothetical protein
LQILEKGPANSGKGPANYEKSSANYAKRPANSDKSPANSKKCPHVVKRVLDLSVLILIFLTFGYLLDTHR